MKRKNYWLLFVVLLLSLSTLSPGIDFTKNNSREEVNGPYPPVSPHSSDSDRENITISVAVNMDDKQWIQLQKMNDSFRQETGIEVKLTNYEHDGPELYTEMLKLGEAPDVMLSRSEWIASFASSGYLLPVESYQSSSAGNELLYSLMTLMEWNGYQWGTPFDMDPYLLVWQNEQLKELGVSEPPGSLAKWQEVLSKLEGRDTKPYVTLDTGNYYGLASLMGGAEESLLSLSKEQIAWLKRLNPYVEIDMAAGAVWQKLQEGHLLVGVVPASTASEQKISSLLVQLPKLLYTQHPAFLRSRSFAVSASTAHPKEASAWITYMTSEVNQEEWLTTTNQLPARRFIYDSSTLSLLYVPFDVGGLLESTVEDITDKGVTAEQWSTLTRLTGDLIQGNTPSQDALGFLSSER